MQKRVRLRQRLIEVLQQYHERGDQQAISHGPASGMIYYGDTSYDKICVDTSGELDTTSKRRQVIIFDMNSMECWRNPSTTRPQYLNIDDSVVEDKEHR
eukprot:3273374-Pyramimonas_sp.AAC.1